MKFCSPGRSCEGVFASSCFHAANEALKPPASAMFSPKVSSPLTCRGLPSGPGTVNSWHWSIKHCTLVLKASTVLLSHHSVKFPVWSKCLPVESKAFQSLADAFGLPAHESPTVRKLMSADRSKSTITNISGY